MTPRTVALQAPLSLGFSRQEQWCGSPCPPPGWGGVFPAQGRNPCLLRLLHQRVGSSPWATWEAPCECCSLSIQCPRCARFLSAESASMEGWTSSVSFLWQSLCSSGDAEVKNHPAHAGDPGDSVQSLGREDPPEEEMATHSSILAWRIPTGRGAWRATVRGHKESDSTEPLNTRAHNC